MSDAMVLTCTPCARKPPARDRSNSELLQDGYDQQHSGGLGKKIYNSVTKPLEAGIDAAMMSSMHSLMAQLGKIVK